MIDIQYQLIRSSRKTICISIRNNKVIVRAPLRTSIESIESFIAKKKSWILKQLATCCVFDELADYKHVLVKGEKVPIVYGDVNKIENNRVIVKNLSCLNKLYYLSFKQEFLQLFEELSSCSGLRAKSVSFKSYKARWGCCDSKKNIVFSYKLLMLPVHLWQCVIVHELCHTVFMDHSKNFKLLAQSIMPDYNTVHKELKKYSFITRLY